MQEQNAEKLQEKRKRMVVALTVAGTMLLLFLIIILCIQFAKIAVARAESKRLDKEIEEYNRILEEVDKSELAYYSSEFGKYYLALQQGWKPSKG